MSKAFKKCLTLVLTFAMALCLFLGAANTVLADNGFTVDDVTTLAMGSGAEVRVATDDAERGLRFTATISENDYDGLKNNADYSAVSFGMIIAPAEWTEIYELTEENVFGANAKYCWGEDQTGKAKIINLTANTLSNLDEDTRFMKGSIVGLQDFNIGREFVAKAYVKATDAEGDHYAFATYANGDKANNVRSMTAVALDAINDNSEFALDPDVKEELRKAYVAKSVAVECYLETAESSGDYALAATKYVSAANGATVTVEDARLSVPNGYILNTSEEGTKLSTTVNTEGTNETLKVYCEKVAASVTNVKDVTDKYHTALKIDTELEEGSIAKVTFKIKATDLKGGNCGMTWIGAKGEYAYDSSWPNFGNFDWKEMTVTVKVMKGTEAVYSLHFAGGTTEVNWVTGQDESVGIWFAFFNHFEGYVAIKDVVIEEAPDYYVAQTAGEYYSAIMIPTELPANSVVKVDYKIKSTDPAFLGVFWVGSTGAIDLDINIWTAGAPKCVDWTDATATVKVTDGPTAMRIFDDWATDSVADLGMTGLSNDTGIWLVMCNHCGGNISLKDVEITVISQPSSEYDILVSPASAGKAHVMVNFSSEFEQFADVSLTFKIKSEGITNNVGICYRNRSGANYYETATYPWNSLKDCTEWTEITIDNMWVLNCGAAGYCVGNSAVGVPGNSLDSNPAAYGYIDSFHGDAWGVWLLFYDFTAGSIMIKDIVVTAK